MYHVHHRSTRCSNFKQKRRASRCCLCNTSNRPFIGCHMLPELQEMLQPCHLQPYATSTSCSIPVLCRHGMLIAAAHSGTNRVAPSDTQVYAARSPGVAVRPLMRPSGEAPSQPCTQSSRSTRKRQPLTACPVSASYRASAAVSCACKAATWRPAAPNPFGWHPTW